MPDNEMVPGGILVEKNSIAIDWNSRSDQDGMQPFPQTPSDQSGDLPSASPHEIFTFFTADIILQKKIFIR